MPREKKLLKQIAEFAKKHPTHCAIESAEGDFISYEALMKKSLNIAAQLHKYIKPVLNIDETTIQEPVLGIVVDRTQAYWIIAVLACWHAGIAVALFDMAFEQNPQDLRFKADENKKRMATANCQGIIRLRNMSEYVFPEYHNDKTDFVWEDFDHSAAQAFDYEIPTARYLRYIAFSSGSSGDAKAIALPDAGIVTAQQAYKNALDLTFRDRVLQASKISFDVTWAELFMLGLGMTIVLVSDPSPDISALVTYARNKKITVATFVPTFLKNLDPSALPDLRAIVSTGEKAYADTFNKWLKRNNRPDRIIANGYGPTQMTIGASLTVYQNGLMNIGNCFPDTNIYLLDDETNQPVPEGETGVIAIAGLGIARGYIKSGKLNLAEMHSEFIEIGDPENSGEKIRIYKTADEAKCEQGKLFFIRRIDNTIKYNGENINLLGTEQIIKDTIDSSSVTQVLIFRIVDDTYKKDYFAVIITHREHVALDILAIHQAVLRKTGTRMPMQIYTIHHDHLPATLLQNQKIQRNQKTYGTIPKTHLHAIHLEPASFKHEFESQVADIWFEFTSAPRNTVYMNSATRFSEMNGNSLDFYRFCTKLYDLFDLGKLKLHEHMTIAEISTEIARYKFFEQSWTLLGLASKPSTTKNNPKIFICPPVSGSCLFSEKAGNPLNVFPQEYEQYGLDMLALLIKPQTDNHLKSLLAYYQTPGVACIKMTSMAYYSALALQQRHRGPYILAGYSFGALLVYEIARVLQTNQQKIIWLGLLDEVAPKQISDIFIHHRLLFIDQFKFVVNSISQRMLKIDLISQETENLHQQLSPYTDDTITYVDTLISKARQTTTDQQKIGMNHELSYILWLVRNHIIASVAHDAPNEEKIILDNESIQVFGYFNDIHPHFGTASNKIISWRSYFKQTINTCIIKDCDHLTLLESADLRARLAKDMRFISVKHLKKTITTYTEKRTAIAKLSEKLSKLAVALDSSKNTLTKHLQNKKAILCQLTATANATSVRISDRNFYQDNLYEYIIPEQFTSVKNQLVDKINTLEEELQLLNDPKRLNTIRHDVSRNMPQPGQFIDGKSSIFQIKSDGKPMHISLELVDSTELNKGTISILQYKIRFLHNVLLILEKIAQVNKNVSLKKQKIILLENQIDSKTNRKYDLLTDLIREHAVYKQAKKIPTILVNSVWHDFDSFYEAASVEIKQITRQRNKALALKNYLAALEQYDSKDVDKINCLFGAVLTGNLNIFQKIIAFMSPVELTTAFAAVHQGETLLHTVVRENQLAMTQIILKLQVPIDFLIKNLDNQTPLQLAQSLNHSQITACLYILTETSEHDLQKNKQQENISFNQTAHLLTQCRKSMRFCGAKLVYLLGLPSSGKTTLFNYLAGSNYKLSDNFTCEEMIQPIILHQQTKFHRSKQNHKPDILFPRIYTEDSSFAYADFKNIFDNQRNTAEQIAIAYGLHLAKLQFTKNQILAFVTSLDDLGSPQMLVYCSKLLSRVILAPLSEQLIRCWFQQATRLVITKCAATDNLPQVIVKCQNVISHLEQEIAVKSHDRGLFLVKLLLETAIIDKGAGLILPDIFDNTSEHRQAIKNTFSNMHSELDLWDFKNLLPEQTRFNYILENIVNHLQNASKGYADEVPHHFLMLSQVKANIARSLSVNDSRNDISRILNNQIKGLEFSNHSEENKLKQLQLRLAHKNSSKLIKVCNYHFYFKPSLNYQAQYNSVTFSYPIHYFQRSKTDISYNSEILAGASQKILLTLPVLDKPPAWIKLRVNHTNIIYFECFLRPGYSINEDYEFYTRHLDYYAADIKQLQEDILICQKNINYRDAIIKLSLSTLNSKKINSQKLISEMATLLTPEINHYRSTKAMHKIVLEENNWLSITAKNIISFLRLKFPVSNTSLLQNEFSEISLKNSLKFSKNIKISPIAAFQFELAYHELLKLHGEDGESKKNWGVQKSHLIRYLESNRHELTLPERGALSYFRSIANDRSIPPSIYHKIESLIKHVVNKSQPQQSDTSATIKLSRNHLFSRPAGNTLVHNLSETMARWEQMQVTKATNASLANDSSLKKSSELLNKSARKYGMSCHDVARDGNCFFHAVFAQLPAVFQEQYETAASIRDAATNHIVTHIEYYRDFIECESTLDEFINKLYNNQEWADQIIILSTSRILNCNLVIVRSDDAQPLVIHQQASLGDIILGYEVGLHYQHLVKDELVLHPEQDLQIVIDSTGIDKANPLSQVIAMEKVSTRSAVDVSLPQLNKNEPALPAIIDNTAPLAQNVSLIEPGKKLNDRGIGFFPSNEIAPLERSNQFSDFSKFFDKEQKIDLKNFYSAAKNLLKTLILNGDEGGDVALLESVVNSLTNKGTNIKQFIISKEGAIEYRKYTINLIDQIQQSQCQSTTSVNPNF